MNHDENHEENVAGYLQGMNGAALAAVARGEIDIMQVVSQELASRGLDMQGNWVGFDKAAKIHGV